MTFAHNVNILQSSGRLKNKYESEIRRKETNAIIFLNLLFSMKM